MKYVAVQRGYEELLRIFQILTWKMRSGSRLRTKFSEERTWHCSTMTIIHSLRSRVIFARVNSHIQMPVLPCRLSVLRDPTSPPTAYEPLLSITFFDTTARIKDRTADTMLEVGALTRIPMFPANYREFLVHPAAPVVPAAQQTLLPGQIFQLAQPKWPVDSVMPSFYALAATTIFAAFFLVAFKDLAALINYELRTRLGISGNPVVGMTLSLLAWTMLLITYENDIKKRSGYYSEGSDPRYVVGFSAFAALCAVFWASSAFQTPVSAPEESKEAEAKAMKEDEQPRGSRRQQKKQAKREAKKLA